MYTSSLIIAVIIMIFLFLFCSKVITSDAMAAKIMHVVDV